MKTRAASQMIQRWTGGNLRQILNRHKGVDPWAIPSDSGAKTALARQLTSVSERDVLILVHQWGAWPGSQHVPLFDSLRKAHYGELTKLYDCPADLVPWQERDYATSLLATGLYFAWSILLVSEKPSFSYFASHEKFMSAYASDPDLRDQLQKLMSSVAAPFRQGSEAEILGPPG
ncbi:MAG TPA: hypothetical protein VEX38_09825 [Fimbriimonadaceae bacterium]|nr:hypothetical protein [Fimbriimonadaceae bacterium]